MAEAKIPTRECDLVMKGGITSGVIYPGALIAFSRSFRFRGVGGASAGAIGAAFGAAAEFGRASGGFDELAKIPGELGGGALGKLFQPQPGTRPLMELLNRWLDAGKDRSQRASAVLATLIGWILLGAVPGLVLIVMGLLASGVGWVLAGAGFALVILGAVAVPLLRLWRLVTRALPANRFGICRGLGTDAQPGFTDWLAERIDVCAGLPPEQRPLTFGQLWGSRDGERQIDLRMVTTCLTMGRPFELPVESTSFFYDPVEWRTLFPGYVVQALEDAVPQPSEAAARESDDDWEDWQAWHQSPRLRRLPSAEHLPVVVATRLSLSFPVLISAMPMWHIDRGSKASWDAVRARRDARKDQAPPPTTGLRFVELLFSDGGLCSNFPVHLFDSALSTRPTFAINLSPFPDGQEPSPDQSQNVDWARSNDRGLHPTYAAIPGDGAGALFGFAAMAARTARDWQDSSHIAFPGFRDRIVHIYQTGEEGGLNLNMDAEVIRTLSDRGHAGAEAIIGQFDGMHYKFEGPEGAEAPTRTGWENHRWVRYRALMSVLPDWLESYATGRAVLDVDPANPPSYSMTKAGRELAADLDGLLSQAAARIAEADPVEIANLVSAPSPSGMLRRTPVT